LSVMVSDISFSYGKRLILDKVDFRAESGEFLSVVGPNGVGKSTLFNCILGLLNGYHGQILINETNIKNLTIKEMAKLIAFIPQNHYPSFNFNVFDMVVMGTSNQFSSISMPGTRQYSLVEDALERMGIMHLKDRGYINISGGERQLVLIARALAQQTMVLVLDEPTANLDFGNQIRVLTQIKSLAKDGYTIIQSTHNPEQAFMFSDTVLALHQGKVLAHGTPSEILTGDLIRQLYGIEVEIHSLYQDRVRFCIPTAILNDRASESNLAKVDSFSGRGHIVQT
jgi:iron complex transport system ATP-binding protein